MKINIIDVGSSGGLPSPLKQHRETNIGSVLSFEPREGTPALWNKDETRPFYLFKNNPLGSSLFEQNVEWVKQNVKNPRHSMDRWVSVSTIDRVVEIECRTLDGVLSEMGDAQPYHFMKIDVQGAEHQVLQGAEMLLSENGFCGLFLELFNIPLYKGITLLPEVVEYLKRFGFSLAKKMPVHGSFNSQHDCLFLKEDGDEEALETIRKIYGL